MAQDAAILEELVLQCVERMESDGAAALDALCAEHPDHAAALRSAITPLVEIGMVGATIIEGDDWVAGKRIGDFELVRELGRGGMGVVFEARQCSLDRSVALKLLMRPFGLDETSVRRFEREARTAGSLRHEGIVEVHAFGRESGLFYLAMERIEGVPLDQLLHAACGHRTAQRKERSLVATARGLLRSDPSDDADGTHALGAAGEIAAIAVQLCDALDYAHRSGVVHRDIKPSNILLRADGAPVLTDFGLAQDRTLPSLTQTGAFVGTPHYTAPEQILAARDVDERADIFSLGATVYELLTVVRPFDGASTHEILHNVARRDPVEPTRIDARIPPDLSAVVLKALEKDPARRYPSAAEFGADLRAFLARRPVSAKRIGAVARAVRWARREPVRASLIAVLVAAIPLLAGLGGYVIANRPLVEAAAAQRALTAAEQSIIRGYLAVLDHERGRHSASAAGRQVVRAALTTALDHPETRFEALAMLALSRLEDDPGAALVELDRRAGPGIAPRAIRLLRAWCLERLDRVSEANAITDALGEPVDALEHYLLGIQVFEDPRNRGAPDRERRALAHLHAAAMLAERPRPLVLHRLAAIAGDIPDEPIARAAAAALQRHWPNSSFAWEGCALALEDIDQERALQAYRNALAAPESRSVRILGNAGQHAGRMRKLDLAYAWLDEAIEKDSARSFAYYARSRTQLFAGRDPAGAVPFAERAVELSVTAEDRSNAFRLLIRALAMAERMDDALSCALRAIEQLPEVPILRRDRLYCLESLERFDELIAGCHVELERGQDQYVMHGLLADAYKKTGRFDDALESLEVRARARPDNARSWYELAVFALREDAGGERNDPALGLSAALRATQIEPDDPFHLHVLGNAYLAIGDRGEARGALQRCGELIDDPAWAERAAKLRPELEASLRAARRASPTVSGRR